MEIVVAPKRRRVREIYLNDGGEPALNFINTCKKDGKGGYIDRLTNYSTFLNWCAGSNLIDHDRWLILDLEQYCYMHEAKQIYSEVLSARNCMDELFNCLANGMEVHPLILERFDVLALAIRPHLRYENAPHGVALYWRAVAEEMNLPLWLIVSSACKLIDSGEWRKLKKCPVCGSLFLDRTRSSNKRWCNPNTCGSLQKSNKYYALKNAKNRPEIAL